MGLVRLGRRVVELGRVYPVAGVAYLRRSTKVSYLPTNVWIEPTNVCNLDCTMCPSGLIPAAGRGFIDPDLVRNLMQQLRGVRPTVYLHMGGEPLLHPRIDELVRIVASQGGSPNLFTNAATLDADLGGRLIDAGLDWMGFSFDGFDAATYEAVRRRGRFDQVLANIRGFLDLKRERGVSRPYTHLSLVKLPEVMAATTPEGRRSFKKSLLELGLDRFDEVAPHNWAGTFATWRRIPERGGRFAVCPSPWTSLVVLWDGTVVPCCLDMLRRHPVGDAKTQSLREIMSGPRMTELRSQLGRGCHGEVDICRDCDVPRGKSLLGVSEKVFAELADILRTFAS